MTVKRLLRMTQTTVAPDEHLERAWKLLARRDITLLAVVDEKRKLIGVIGEDDLLYLLVPDYREYFSEFFPDSPDEDDLEEKLEKEIELTASDVMNRRMVTAREDWPIYKALARMMTYHVRALPVVDEEKKYLGMIYEDDIMREIFRRLPSPLKAIRGNK